MSTVLYEEIIAGVVKVDFVKEQGSNQVTLCVKNDAKIERELKVRRHVLHRRGSDIPGSAHALFKLIEAKLRELGFRIGSPQLYNLPVLPPTENDFSATVEIMTDDKNDSELRDLFGAAVTVAKARMGEKRFQRRVDGNLTDRGGGTITGTQGL